MLWRTSRGWSSMQCFATSWPHLRAIREQMPLSSRPGTWGSAHGLSCPWPRRISEVSWATWIRDTLRRHTGLGWQLQEVWQRSDPSSDSLLVERGLSCLRPFCMSPRHGVWSMQSYVFVSCVFVFAAWSWTLQCIVHYWISKPKVSWGAETHYWSSCLRMPMFFLQTCMCKAGPSYTPWYLHKLGTYSVSSPRREQRSALMFCDFRVHSLLFFFWVRLCRSQHTEVLNRESRRVSVYQYPTWQEDSVAPIKHLPFFIPTEAKVLPHTIFTFLRRELSYK